jgi:hypothetical protein
MVQKKPFRPHFVVGARPPSNMKMKIVNESE